MFPLKMTPMTAPPRKTAAAPLRLLGPGAGRYPYRPFCWGWVSVFGARSRGVSAVAEQLVQDFDNAGRPGAPQGIIDRLGVAAGLYQIVAAQYRQVLGDH